MGNSESREKNESVRISNETEIPLVYVISMMGPLYWGVLQPGESVTRQTGRVWVTVATYPYTGDNEPTTAQAAAGIVVPSIMGIMAIAMGGPIAGPLGSMIGLVIVNGLPQGRRPDEDEREGIVVNVGGKKYTVSDDFVKKCEQCLNEVKITGHYANGDWIWVRKGIKKDVPYQNWEPMVMDT